MGRVIWLDNIDDFPFEIQNDECPVHEREKADVLDRKCPYDEIAAFVSGPLPKTFLSSCFFLSTIVASRQYFSCVKGGNRMRRVSYLRLAASLRRDIYKWCCLGISYYNEIRILGPIQWRSCVLERVQGQWWARCRMDFR